MRLVAFSRKNLINECSMILWFWTWLILAFSSLLDLRVETNHIKEWLSFTELNSLSLSFLCWTQLLPSCYHLQKWIEASRASPLFLSFSLSLSLSLSLCLSLSVYWLNIKLTNVGYINVRLNTIEIFCNRVTYKMWLH